MKQLWRVLGFLFLLAVSAQGEGIYNLANFQDGWGNTGGFWQVNHDGQDFLLLKVRNKDKKGEANIVFTREQFDEFEENLRELKQTHNTMKRDGFEVGKTIVSGDASQSTIYARMNGVKVKMLQVVQRKNGEKFDHGIAINADCYREIQLAIKKVRRKLHWQ